VSRWLFPQGVGRLQALASAAKWLSDHPGISRRARETPVTKGRLVHVPIWEHKALVAGWEFGTKLRTRSFLVTSEDGNERLDLAITEEPFEEPRLQERRLFQAACDLTRSERPVPVSVDGSYCCLWLPGRSILPRR
jgi:hypothetical protein